jgi:hypothetical protein
MYFGLDNLPGTRSGAVVEDCARNRKVAETIPDSFEPTVSHNKKSQKGH